MTDPDFSAPDGFDASGLPVDAPESASKPSGKPLTGGDDFSEIPPYEPVPAGVTLTDFETGMEVDARPQQAARAARPPCQDNPRTPDAPAAAPDASSQGPLGDYSAANLAGCKTPKDIALQCGAAQRLAEQRAREEEIKSKAYLPELPAEAKAAIDKSIPPSKRPMPCVGVPLGQLPDPLPENENPAALFKNGWLRKGGGAFIVAPSGVGKSSLTIQAAMCWSLGREFFGIFPVRRLRIGIIQSEDDQTEVSWFRNSIRDGLVSDFDFSLDELNSTLGAIVPGREEPVDAHVEMFRLVGLTGEAFVNAVGAILDNRPDIDLLIVNPFHAYFGADVSKNSEVSQFLRTWLDPEIKSPLDDGKDRAGVIFVHHTNKPPSKDDEREFWGVDQFAAYIGAGGAELVNWARAVLSLMPTKVEGVYRLCAGKRGQRLEWVDISDPSKRVRCKLMKHGEGNRIIWLPCGEADAAEVAEAAGKKGVRGAVGGNGGGGIPPVNEPKYPIALALHVVDMTPGQSGNFYRKRIIDLSPMYDKKNHEACSDGTAKNLLEAACKKGFLVCKKVLNCNRYELTEEGRNELGDFEF
jgi:hypothetical protein